MATNTPNYNLRKPDFNDFVDVDTDIAQNMDKIDAHAHSGTYARYSALSILARSVGCVLDGVTNDTVALQAALDSLATTGGEVILDGPAGISAQIVVPDRVWLRAYSVQKTGNTGGGVIALAGFPVSTALVRIGSGAAIVSNCGIRDIDVHCNSIAGSWAVYSNSINEDAGVIGCQLRHFMAGAIDILGGTSKAENFILRDNHTFCSASATASIGIRVANCQCKNTIDNNTVAISAGAVDQDAAVLITGPGSATDGYGYVSRLHVENHTSGVRFGSGGQGIARDIEGRNCSAAVVEFASGAGRATAYSVRRTGTSTVSILDSNRTNARSITATPVPLYTAAGVATAYHNSLAIYGDDAADMFSFYDAAGVLKARFDPIGRFWGRAGAAAGPSISFNDGQSYGFFYLGSPASLGIAAAGVEFAHITAGAMVVAAGKNILGGDPNALTSGESTMKRDDVHNNGVTIGSGTLRLAYFTATKTETITQMRLCGGGTAAGATPTLVRAGIYSVAANGDIALLASIASDTSIFATAGSEYLRGLSGGNFSKVAESRYAVGTIVVTAAAVPTGMGQASLLGAAAGRAPRVCGAVTGQTDLPSSVVAASIIDSPNRLYSELVP